MNPITTPGGKLLIPTYPILAYAPGNYTCTCCVCKNDFFGDKRAVMCEPCAIEKQYPGGVNIGTLTLKEGRVDFGFDPEPFVEVYDKMDSGKPLQWPDYIKLTGCDSPQDSFLSRIAASNGVYFFNPMGENKPELNPVCCGRWIPSYADNNVPECCDSPVPSEESLQMQAEWQSWEDKLVKTVAVILIK